MTGRPRCGGQAKAASAPRIAVEAVLEADGWTALTDAQVVVERAAAAAFAAAPPPAGDWTVCVLLADDAAVAALNAQFRGEAGATDVLSWPAFAAAPGPDGRPGPVAPPQPPGAGPPRHLGDIALALETVTAQAAALSLALEAHAIHLIVHACLHLLGYDHAGEADMPVMRGLERQAMASLGLGDPYG